jgi:IrrE N-terminal-like domain
MTKVDRGPAYAKALLAELKVSGPTDARSIAERLQLDVSELDVQGFDGALIRAKGTPFGAIIVRDSIRESSRKNFTVAHEIGHFVLPGHEDADLVCTSSDVGNWSNSAKEFELEANEFASELLMPKPLVRQIMGSSEPSFSLIDRIANSCQASLSAAGWRFCHLTSHRCAVIWSVARAISWSRRSEEFRFGISRSGPIRNGTFAFDCFAGQDTPDRPEPVAADLWLESQNIAPDAQIWEQSKALPSYSSVLTLLWIKERVEIYSDYDEEASLDELDPEQFRTNRGKWPR